MLGQEDSPGERRRHHKGRGCGCRGIGLLVLSITSVIAGMLRIGTRCIHRLKLVTGVDISTRPVRRLGSEGKAKKRTSRRAAAEVKRKAFRRSITMFDDLSIDL